MNPNYEQIGEFISKSTVLADAANLYVLNANAR